MASAVRTLTANFVGRTDNLEKAYKRVSKGSALMSDRIQGATRRAGMAFGIIGGAAIGAAAALKPMIDQAASVQESLSKNTVVFGESAAAVEKFADTSLQSFGVTHRAALEATGVIGTLGKAMGMAEADSAEMATTLVGLAGDMSSFNDASVEETLTAIQAGLRGESEPLRRFGVLLDAATLKSKALAEGIITNTKEALTPQQKALAAYQVILEQAAVQMGDFERTSDSATNQQKLFAGSLDRIRTEIGDMLLPAFTAVVAYLNENLIPALSGFADDVRKDGLFEAAFSNLGEMLGDALRGGAEESLGKWKVDEKWWTTNLYSWVQEKILKATALVAEGAGLIQFPHQPGGGPPQHTPTGDPGTGPVGVGAGGSAINRHPAAAAAAAAAGAAAAAAVEAVTTPARQHPAAAAAAAANAAAAASPTPAPARQHPAAAAARAARDPELDRFLEVVGTPDWNAFIAAQAQGGPPNTQVTVNVSGVVSGNEVLEALAGHVDLNGPLPAEWTQ